MRTLSGDANAGETTIFVARLCRVSPRRVVCVQAISVGKHAPCRRCNFAKNSGYNAAMTALQLAPHPSTPCDFIHALSVHAKPSGDSLQLTYVVSGDVQRLTVPESRPSARVDGLWSTTCFEIFLRPQGLAAYQEFNFSPSGEWATYSFTGYRQGMTALEQPQPPRISCVCTAQQLQVDVHFQSPLLGQPDLRAALTAVLKHGDGRLSYWALAHPPAKPDFHDAVGFVAEGLGVG
jgi:hypothetical protein